MQFKKLIRCHQKERHQKTNQTVEAGCDIRNCYWYKKIEDNVETVNVLATLERKHIEIQQPTRKRVHRPR